jgi:glycosyltransferase involved in cell wall biosynthesis
VKETRIAILLSTYNSDRYLTEQIDSVISQTKKEWVLYIRDDGSTDGTLALIEKFCSANDNIVFLKDTDKNLGASNSFIKLLSSVEAPYFMFCDHDDVWLPQKIEKTFRKMFEEELNYPQAPILIFTDLIVADKNLNIINQSLWKYQKSRPVDALDTYALSISNPVTGCTVMINNKAKEVSLPMPADSLMHDLWIALNVSHYGHINFVEEPTLLYRQHSENVVGAKNADGFYFLSRFLHLYLVLKDNLLMIRMINALSFKINHFKRIYLKAKMLYTRMKSRI